MCAVAAGLNLPEMLELRLALAERSAAKGLYPYLREVVINRLPEPRPFWAVSDPWQRDRCTELVPALQRMIDGTRRHGDVDSFFFTFPRGHDKTGLIGRMLNWLLCFSPRRLDMACAAADTDQAGLLMESMLVESRLNPWLGARLHFGTDRVTGKGGLLRVLSADAPTSYGLNCDVIVADELTHWKKQDLWGALWTGRRKRPGAVFIVITNAGLKGSWQEEVLRAARTDPTWCVFESPGWLAGWMDKTALLRDERLLPPILVRRVLKNEWVDPAEEAGYLSRSDVLACEALGRDGGLGPQDQGRPGVHYFAGIDYGPKRDRTALAVLHFDPKEGRVVLDGLDVWQGSPEAPVAVQRVDDWIQDLNRRFTNPTLVIDPYQMEGTIQKYEIRQPVKRFEARGGKSNYEMAQCLRTLVANRQLVWWPGAGTLPADGETDDFSSELLRLVIRPTTYGYRFDHTVKFHDDRAVAVGMAAYHAATDLRTGLWVKPSLVVPDPADNPFDRRPSTAIPAVERRNIWGVRPETNWDRTGDRRR